LNEKVKATMEDGMVNDKSAVARSSELHPQPPSASLSRRERGRNERTARFVATVVLGMVAVAGSLKGDAPAPLEGSYAETIPKTVIEFQMIKIPGGTITIGGKEVTIKSMWVGKTEVTWDEYDLWAFQTDLTDEQKAKGVDAEARPSKPYGAPDRGFGHHLYPALGIPHHAAEMYCKWLSAKTGHTYRLPTEAEWEYACRAGNKTEGKLDAEALDKVGWYEDNAEDKAHPVGKKEPNAWGLYDTIGNVSEWVKTADGKWVVRGGSYNDALEDVHCGAVMQYDIGWQAADPQNPKSKWWLSDGPFVGFRMVRDAE
jgi:formylglycine-generating enzyme required for sulfatase activity